MCGMCSGLMYIYLFLVIAVTNPFNVAKLAFNHWNESKNKTLMTDLSLKLYFNYKTNLLMVNVYEQVL